MAVLILRVNGNAGNLALTAGAFHNPGFGGHKK
jgi:hypothetical protein